MTVSRTLGFCALLALAACGSKQEASQDSLDAAARDYVQLSLTIGEKEAGYIDAYYGPPAIKAAAVAGDQHFDLGQHRVKACQRQ